MKVRRPRNSNNTIKIIKVTSISACCLHNSATDLAKEWYHFNSAQFYCKILLQWLFSMWIYFKM